jgi:hypothetical protein
MQGPVHEANKLGEALAKRLLDLGGRDILKELI